MTPRLLRDEDAGALARFFQANDLPETRAFFHPFSLDEASAERIAKHAGRDLYFATFDGDEVIGFAMLRGWDEGFETPSFGLLVDARERGRGLGQTLTQYALRLAAENSCQQVRLTVSAENLPAIRLYQRLGFRTSEALPDGRLVMLAPVSR